MALPPQSTGKLTPDLVRIAHQMAGNDPIKMAHLLRQMAQTGALAGASVLMQVYDDNVKPEPAPSPEKPTDEDIDAMARGLAAEGGNPEDRREDARLLLGALGEGTVQKLPSYEANAPWWGQTATGGHTATGVQLLPPGVVLCSTGVWLAPPAPPGLAAAVAPGTTVQNGGHPVVMSDREPDTSWFRKAIGIFGK